MFTAVMLESQENKISLLDAVQCQTKGLWHLPKKGEGREPLRWVGAGPRPVHVHACGVRRLTYLHVMDGFTMAWMSAGLLTLQSPRPLTALCIIRTQDTGTRERQHGTHPGR